MCGAEAARAIRRAKIRPLHDKKLSRRCALCGEHAVGGDDGAVDLALASLAADAAERDHLDAGAVDYERAVRRGRGGATVGGKGRTHVVGARPGDEQAVLVAEHDGVERGVAPAGSELERERGPETRRAMLAAIHFHRQIVPKPRGETNFIAVRRRSRPTPSSRCR